MMPATARQVGDLRGDLLPLVGYLAHKVGCPASTPLLWRVALAVSRGAVPRGLALDCADSTARNAPGSARYFASAYRAECRERGISPRDSEPELPAGLDTSAPRGCPAVLTLNLPRVDSLPARTTPAQALAAAGPVDAATARLVVEVEAQRRMRGLAVWDDEGEPLNFAGDRPRLQTKAPTVRAFTDEGTGQGLPAKAPTAEPEPAGESRLQTDHRLITDRKQTEGQTKAQESFTYKDQQALRTVQAQSPEKNFPNALLETLARTRPEPGSDPAFKLARAIRSLPGAVEAGPLAFKPAVLAWHGTWHAELDEACADQFWMDFATKWDKVRVPLPKELFSMQTIVRRALENPLPAAAGNFKMRLPRVLVGVCREAQREEGPGQTFFLPTRELARALTDAGLPITHACVAKWLKLLRIEKIIAEAEPGNAKRSPRLRFLPPLDDDLPPELQQCEHEPAQPAG